MYTTKGATKVKVKRGGAVPARTNGAIFSSDASLEQVILDKPILEENDTNAAINKVVCVPLPAVAVFTQANAPRMELAPRVKFQVVFLGDWILVYALYDVVAPANNPLQPTDVRLFVAAPLNTAFLSAEFTVYRLGAPKLVIKPETKTKEEADADQAEADRNGREHTGTSQDGNYLRANTLVGGGHVLDRVVIHMSFMIPTKGDYVAFLTQPKMCPAGAGYFSSMLTRHPNRPWKKVLSEKLVRLTCMGGTTLCPYDVPLANTRNVLFQAISDKLFSGTVPPVQLSFAGMPIQQDKVWTLTFCRMDSSALPRLAVPVNDGLNDGLPISDPVGTHMYRYFYQQMLCCRISFVPYGTSRKPRLTFLGLDVSGSTTVVQLRPLLAVANNLTVAAGSKAFLFDHIGENPLDDGFYRPNANGHFDVPDRGHGGTVTKLGIDFLQEQVDALEAGTPVSLVLLSDCAIDMATIDELTRAGGYFDQWSAKDAVDVYFGYSGPYVSPRSVMQAKLDAWRDRVNLIYVDHTLTGHAFTKEIMRCVAAVQGEQPKVRLTLGEGTCVLVQGGRAIDGDTNNVYTVQSAEPVTIYATHADTVVHVAVKPNRFAEEIEYPRLSNCTVQLADLDRRERIMTVVPLAQKARPLWEVDLEFKARLQTVLVKTRVVMADLTQQSEIGEEMQGERPDRATCEATPRYTAAPWTNATLRFVMPHQPYGGPAPRPVWRSLPAVTSGGGASYPIAAAASYPIAAAASAAPPVYRSLRVVRPNGATMGQGERTATSRTDTSRSLVVFMNLDAYSTENLDPLQMGVGGGLLCKSWATLTRMKTCHFLITMIPYYQDILRRENSGRDTFLYAELELMVLGLWSIDMCRERVWNHIERAAYYDPQFMGTREAGGGGDET